MTTCMFPGQGSQIIGMGKALFPKFPQHLNLANEILGYDMTTLCLEDPNKLLNNTLYTQPALYVVNALSYLKRQEEITVLPDFVVGHSLGELNALYAAGAFDFETGLRIVQKRAELMSQATGGKMAAVLGLNEQAIRQVLEQPELQQLSVANYNSDLQIVISGPKSKIELAETYFTQAGASLYLQLNVSGAFHSPMMAEAAQEFELFLQEFSFSAPMITIIANTSGQPYDQDIAKTLAKQMTHSVLWNQSIRYLMAQGETIFEELGPQQVLTGLINRIKNGL
ncbi:Polyketide biosynthesis malonyl CoA-acyl carrier protein transacylase BaeC [Legionella massiliensis]|uniref:Malonyl CoA-acyl carrier protein transacylase n=1 Tax=Legionella massiliensis TaxID=1034943 RepID=A0A078KVU3_9GAMM|nr:ACP S-malonyltransferase [Legionella massiliensis]CDZ77127.1 Polyketide biosynthesis malonyl CoA-acyl carrier protein transacylase BaeC [Legionella massiliensis]CEE12865.1 Polyketide biosynthesis malonyl CoA-acyl carrier protein transacylase BaeC [Legionella massiliensis]